MASKSVLMLPVAPSDWFAAADPLSTPVTNHTLTNVITFETTN